MAEEQADHFRLDGYIPWVTGGDHADAIVIGAVLEDHRQVLLLLPTKLPGVRAEAPARLVGLAATHTGVVRCDNVRVPRDHLLAGPAENVMAALGGAGTGGLQTSALAIRFGDRRDRLFDGPGRRPPRFARAGRWIVGRAEGDRA